MSTFTNWNGPQVSSVKTSDILALINAYEELKKKVEAHIATTVADNTHEGKTYTDNAISELNDEVQEAFVSDKKLVGTLASYATKTDLETLESTVESDYVSNQELVGTLASYAKAVTLNDYIKINALVQPGTVFETITMLQVALNKLSDLEKQLSVEKNGDTVTKLKASLLEAEGVLTATAKLYAPIIGAKDQLQFDFIKFTAPYAGLTNASGAPTAYYYLLGMLDKRAGTAYIKYSNTDSFAAVINFAVTSKADGTYSGQLSITTDVPTGLTAVDSTLEGLKFSIVTGTSATKEKHIYLAIQTNKLVISSTNLEFEGAGINFYPVNSSDYVAPNGLVAELSGTIDYYSLEDRIKALEDRDSPEIGTISLWGNIDANGNPIGFDTEYYHACDGSSIDDASLKTKLGITNYPLIDYSIMRIKGY